MSALPKGANVSLSKEIPGLTGVVVGVDWDTGGERALGDNLALLTLLAGADGKVVSQDHVVHFNQLVSSDLSTAQLEQALGGDDEQVEVELSGVPESVQRIVFVLYLSESGTGRRTLARLRSCIVRVLNLQGGAQIIASANLASGLDAETAISLAELYRRGGEWKFRVLGSGYSSGLAGVARDFGVRL